MKIYVEFVLVMTSVVVAQWLCDLFSQIAGHHPLGSTEFREIVRIRHRTEVRLMIPEFLFRLDKNVVIVQKRYVRFNTFV